MGQPAHSGVHAQKSAQACCRLNTPGHRLVSYKPRDIGQLGSISSDLSLALATSQACCEEQVRDMRTGDPGKGWGGGVLTCPPRGRLCDRPYLSLSHTYTCLLSQLTKHGLWTRVPCAVLRLPSASPSALSLFFRTAVMALSTHSNATSSGCLLSHWPPRQPCSPGLPGVCLPVGSSWQLEAGWCRA